MQQVCSGGGVACSCYTFSNATWGKASLACQWLKQPPSNAPDTTPGYCWPLLSSRPLICESVPLSACNASGCIVSNGLCEGSVCFSYFMVGYNSQPFLFLFGGLLKDVCVLILVGLLGRVTSRGIARAKPRRTNLKKDFDRILYLLDESYTDGESISYEQYCDRVMRTFFPEEFQVWPLDRRSLLRDTIAYVLQDKEIWIRLDASSCVGERRLEGENTVKTQTTTTIDEREGVQAADLKPSRALRTRVEDVLVPRATSYVCFVVSREPIKRMASSVNSFPGVWQFFFYLGGLVLLFVPSLVHVLEELAVTGEQRRLPTPGESVSSLAILYFVLGFRIVNASSFATAILVFVKTAKTVWRGKRRYHSLTIVEKIPFIALSTDNALRGMLLLYALLLLPLMAVNVTYGFSISWPSVLVIFVGIVCVAAVVVLYRFVSPDVTILQTDDDETVSMNDQSSLLATNRRMKSATFGDLGRALLVFLFTEELPTFFITLSMALAFNYAAILKFASDFAVDTPSAVFAFDFNARSVRCVLSFFKNGELLLSDHLSHAVQIFSSFLPFL